MSFNQPNADSPRVAAILLISFSFRQEPDDFLFRARIVDHLT